MIAVIMRLIGDLLLGFFAGFVLLVFAVLVCVLIDYRPPHSLGRRGP